eukprot:scaffold34167_cov70-Phaeocystis_antarctica.AAC.5
MSTQAERLGVVKRVGAHEHVLEAHAHRVRGGRLDRRLEHPRIRVALPHARDARVRVDEYDEVVLRLNGQRRCGGIGGGFGTGGLEHPRQWLECRAAQSRQAHSEEVQEPSWGTAKRPL